MGVKINGWSILCFKSAYTGDYSTPNPSPWLVQPGVLFRIVVSFTLAQNGVLLCKLLSLCVCVCVRVQWGVFVACLEWTVFVCTHTLGSTWKRAFGAAPWWVKMVMDNGEVMCVCVCNNLIILALVNHSQMWQIISL